MSSPTRQPQKLTRKQMRRQDKKLTMIRDKKSMAKSSLSSQLEMVKRRFLIPRNNNSGLPLLKLLPTQET
jgi:hypothetical protein